jgi:hypothetical protein
MNPSLLVTASVAMVLARVGLFALLAGGDPARLLCRWDCGWYVAIADHGYLRTVHEDGGHHQTAWPFLPLLPLLIASIRLLSGLSLPDACMLMACLCSAGIAAVGVRYRALTRAGARDWTWLLLSAAMPFGIYYTTGYSEAPYALLSLATLLLLARDGALAASFPCALLAVTRPTGVWLIPAIAVASLRDAACALGWRRRLARLLPCLIAASGVLVWMAVCAVLARDPLAFVHAQTGWNRHGGNPIRTLGAMIKDGLGVYGQPHPYGAVVALLGIAAVGACTLARRWAEAWFLGATILFALASGSPESMGRFVVANPIFLLVMADLIDRIPRSAGRSACLAACVGLEVFVFHLWVSDWHALV